MKETSAGINKMIKRLNFEKEMLINQEENGSFYVYTEGERKEIPEYNFDSVQQGIEGIDDKVMYLKHALNLFNSSYVISGGITVDQCLVRMAQLENRRKRLEKLVTAAPKQRLGRKGDRHTEYRCTNYDPARIRKALRGIVSEIEEMQLQLDRINNTVLIDITDIAV